MTAAARVLPLEPARRAWLEKLSRTCEDILANADGDRTDRGYVMAIADVEELLGRLRAELRGAAA